MAKEVYIVYGSTSKFDSDVFLDDIFYHVCYPSFMEVFDDREKAMVFFRSKVKEVKNSGCLMGMDKLTEKELYTNQTVFSQKDGASDYGASDIGISYEETIHGAVWELFYANEDELDPDFQEFLPRIFMAKKTIE